MEKKRSSKREDRGEKWKEKHANVRKKHDVAAGPSWLLGQPASTASNSCDRVRDLIDLAHTVMRKKTEGMCSESMMYLDVSQCASRGSWTSDGCLNMIFFLKP